MSKVFLSEQALKDIKKLPKPEFSKIKRKLKILETLNHIGKKLSGKLSHLYSVLSWPYRIIYLINEEGEIWVAHIMHRKDLYRKL